MEKSSDSRKDEIAMRIAALRDLAALAALAVLSLREVVRDAEGCDRLRRGA